MLNEMEPQVAFSGLLPSFADKRFSITTNKIFRMLYHDDRALQNFKTTKRELPLDYIVQNEDFVAAIALHEPGLKIDYAALISKLSELKACSEYRLNVLFETIGQFLNTHDYAVAIAARFINFDLHISILRSYYQPNNDISLLGLFPTSSPGELQEYLMQAEQFSSLDCQKTLVQRWQTYQRATEHAFAELATLKSSAELIDAFGDLDKLMNMHNQKKTLRHEVNRLERLQVLNRDVLRHHNARNANRATRRSQLGQAERHRLRDTTVSAVVRINNEQNVKYLDGGMTAVKIENEMARNGWIKHPDAWESLCVRQNEPAGQVNNADIGSASLISQWSA